MYVSKDSVREKYTPTERQKLQNELLEYYGEIGRKGVEERHSLEPDASVYDTSEEIQHIIELENQLDMLDRADKAGLYDEDMSMLDRLGNTAKEWANRGLYSVDYIAQTAGTALTDYAESQLNEEYNRLINRRQDIVVQLNRITFGLDEDPYGENEARLVKQLENINRYIDENYREKMDTTTNAYRAMERAEKYEDKSVEGLSTRSADAYNMIKDVAGVAITLPLNMYVPGATLAIETSDNAAQKMHKVNDYGGTADEAFWQGATSAAIDLAVAKLPAEDVIKVISSDIGDEVLKTFVEKNGTVASKAMLEYVADYIAGELYQNPDAQFNVDEMVKEALKTVIVNEVDISLYKQK